MTKKEFFKETSLAEIRSKKFVPFETPECNWENLEDIAGTDYFTILWAPISGNKDDQDKFLRHGDKLNLKREYTKENAFKGEMPSKLIQRAFDKIGHIYSGYTIKPYWETDKRLRVIPLTSCVNAGKIFSSMPEEIKITPYANSKRVDMDGARILAKVPSTTIEEPDYTFEFNSVPIKNNANKNSLWRQISSDHTCGHSRHQETGYNLVESGKAYNYKFFCQHEIAAYFAAIEHFVKEGNRIPLEMNPFVIPTLRTARFNVALENNVLLEDNTIVGEDKLRKPKLADKEIFNWMRVYYLGWDETFNAKNSRDGKLRDYKWD